MKLRLAILALLVGLWAAPAFGPELRHVLQHGRAPSTKEGQRAITPWSCWCCCCLR